MSISVRLYLVVTFLVMLWCAGILAAPILKYAGQMELAKEFYSFFSCVCHQNDARSFHLVGEKFGVCIRCAAVYFSFLAGLILMPLLGRISNFHSQHNWILIIAVLPILIDVACNDIGLFTSTTVSRVVTGVLFGATMSWYIIPLFIEGSLQIINQLRIHSSSTGVIHYVRKTQ